ncbi:hypothetical protein BCR44DRAFT_1426508 [Catenaria anguillulae PL171]|uniref:Uncharacterized protein n=1 Tax=Catenaria anguillulae PL171 TaxID=765915 RepID=A0A1Y2I0C1_9FUNG|nr:hypothetical protein BCR44DRAFT_1426508 [Catenaria anguillulae PL171]
MLFPKSVCRSPSLFSTTLIHTRASPFLSLFICLSPRPYSRYTFSDHRSDLLPMPIALRLPRCRHLFSQLSFSLIVWACHPTFSIAHCLRFFYHCCDSRLRSPRVLSRKLKCIQ